MTINLEPNDQLDLAAYIAHRQREAKRPKFRLSEPESIDERRLLVVLRRRCERLLTYVDRAESDSSAPEVIMNAERELIDKAAGEWVYRRGGYKPTWNAIWAALGEADLATFEARYQYVCGVGQAVPQEDRAERLAYVIIARRVRDFINLLNECNARGFKR